MEEEEEGVEVEALAQDMEVATEVGPWEEGVMAEEGEEETDSIPTETMGTADCQSSAPTLTNEGSVL